MEFVATSTDLFFLHLVGYSLIVFWLGRLAGKQK